MNQTVVLLTRCLLTRLKIAKIIFGVLFCLLCLPLLVWSQKLAEMSTDIPQSMGVHVHVFHLKTGAWLITPEDIEQIEAAGFRQVRLDFLKHEISDDKRNLHFERYDKVIHALLSHHLQPVVCLGLLSPQVEDVGSQLAYTMAVLEHYQGLPIIWELSNEPNNPDLWRASPSAAELMQLLRSVVLPLKKAYPQAQFIGPSPAGVPLPYLERCFQLGLLRLVDGVSVHPYQAFPSNKPPESAQGELDTLHAMIMRYQSSDSRTPILLGEWGYSTGEGELSEDQQAQYIVRQALLGVLYKVPVNIWFNWQGTIYGADCRDPECKKENEFGLKTLDGRLKPAYYAIQNLAKTLQGFQFQRRLPTANTDYVLLFTRQNKSLLVYWTKGPSHGIKVQNIPILLSELPQWMVVNFSP